MNNNNYVIKSLELHLFFGRIMKEHSFFLKAGFTNANPSFARKAQFYMQEFDKVLCQAVALGNGVVSNDVLCSGEVVTEYTSLAEKQTQRFTGIPINRNVTAKELRLNCGDSKVKICSEKLSQIKRLNRRVLKLLNGLISFKENLLKKVLQCDMFTMNYPLLIEHITREARLYCDCLKMLEENGSLADRSLREIECFWNRIMMEHSLFIRGLLDPTETELIDSADGFAEDFKALLEQSHNAHSKTLTGNSLEKTVSLRDFKSAGTQGITQCKIHSIILPLLADHVLREANHYIRLLKC